MSGFKRHSLKWRMIAMLLGCWILPVILLVLGSGVYISTIVQKQMSETVKTSAENAIDITKGNLNAAVEASLLASYNPALNVAWQTYKKDDNYGSFANAANDFLSQSYKFDERFTTTYMMLTDEPEHRFNINNNRPYAKILDFWGNISPKILEVSEGLGTKIAFVTYGEHLFLVRNLLSSTYYRFGVLAMELDKHSLLESISDVAWNLDYTVWIDDDVVDYKTRPILWEGDKRAAGEAEYVMRGGQPYVYGNLMQEYYDVSYCIEIDPMMLYNQRTNMTIIIIGILIILVPLLILVFYFFYQKVTRPINRLSRAAEEIENGRFGLQINSDGLASAEFGRLGDQFNDMSAKLKNQFERIYSEELALRDARIMALQSQINPHFLNNTLEIINWEARLAGDIKVCKMIEALSTMLGAAMDRRHRPLVHLSEELMYVDSYLYIIKERLGKRLTVIKEVQPETLDLDVPRLVLQPIIENAVEHGVNTVAQGTIKIRTYISGDNLVLEIENDGECSREDMQRIETLLSDELLAENTGSASLGIRNVNQRLKILYGNDCGLLVKMTNEGHILAQISINIKQDAQ